MTLKAFNGFINIQLAHMNALIGRTARKRGICLPINIQRRSAMKTKLLSTLSTSSVPDNRRFVNPSAENIIPALIPLQCKNGTFMLPKC